MAQCRAQKAAEGSSLPMTIAARRARIDRTLAALADPHRRGIVELLRERPRCAGEIADALGLSAPTLSRHLKQLRDNGLVEETHPDFDACAHLFPESRRHA